MEMNKHAYRRQWLRTLAKQEGTLAAFAAKIGSEANYLSSVLGPSAKRNIGDDVARRVEDTYELPRGSLDLPSVATRSLIDEAAGMSEEKIQETLKFMRYLKSGKN